MINELNQVNEPLATNSTQASHQVSLRVFFLSITLVALIAIVGTYLITTNFLPKSTSTADMVVNSPIATDAALPVVIAEPAIPASPAPTDQAVKNEVLSLYRLSLQIPSTWTLTEVNRRPEPTRPGDPVTGHDCAEYQIESPNKYVKLHLQPTCGFSDGGPNEWPSDAVVVKNGDTSSTIIRFSNSGNTYSYGQGGLSEINDANGSAVTRNFYSTVLSYKQGTELIFMAVDLSYSGPATEKNTYLTLSDQIVTSIK